MTFRVTLWYAASDEDAPQVETGLSAEQILIGVGAFMRDMIRLEGRGVRKLTVEVENA